MQHLFPSYNHTRCPQQTCPYHCQASAIPMSNLRPSPLPFLCLHQALSGMLTLSTSLEKYRYSFSFLFLHLEKAKKNQLLCWEYVGYSSQLFSLVLENLFCPLLKHKGQLPLGKDVHQMWLCSCSVYGKCIKRWMTWILCRETKRRWVKRALELFPRGQSPATGAEITPCNYPPKHDLHGFTQTIYLSLK